MMILPNEYIIIQDTFALILIRISADAVLCPILDCQKTAKNQTLVRHELNFATNFINECDSLPSIKQNHFQRGLTYGYIIHFGNWGKVSQHTHNFEISTHNNILLATSSHSTIIILLYGSLLLGGGGGGGGAKS